MPAMPCLLRGFIIDITHHERNRDMNRSKVDALCWTRCEIGGERIEGEGRRKEGRSRESLASYSLSALTAESEHTFSSGIWVLVLPRYYGSHPPVQYSTVLPNCAKRATVILLSVSIVVQTKSKTEQLKSVQCAISRKLKQRCHSISLNLLLISPHIFHFSVSIVHTL